MRKSVAMAQRDLRQVKTAAADLEKARGKLRDAILAARRSGETLRDIGDWAGLAHSRIAELVKEAEKLERDEDG